MVDIQSAADLPAVSEPWFLGLGARVSANVVMTPEEIAGLNLGGLGQKYG